MNNIKVTRTDLDTGEEKVLFSRTYPLENFCRDYGFTVSEDELLEWEERQEIKIPHNIPDNFDIQRFIQSIEERLIAQALKTTGGNKKQAARILGMQRTTLQEKVKRQNIITEEVSEQTNKLLKAQQFYRELNGKVSRAIAGKDDIRPVRE